MFELLMLTSLVLAVCSQLLPQAEEPSCEENTEDPEPGKQHQRSANNCYQVSNFHQGAQTTKPLQIKSARALPLK